ncbi:MAG TPA: nitrous oxide reductase family maturation protein NosD [Candidatus Binatia bacterium]|nr:nitrous oxide reductase family maturation protein NosD [Candidatus Binatia bacterium]
MQPAPVAPPERRAPGAAPRRERRPDPAASLTIVLVALGALAFSWMLPWWFMKSRAPQYGQRVLVVAVGPRAVSGDLREVDMLGHYVGIRSMQSFANVERALAPLGMAGVALGLVAAPWLRRRWQRLLAVLPALLFPTIFLVDLKLWMNRAVNDRNPEAALSLTVQRIDPKLITDYEVGQFKVSPELGAGMYLMGVAALLGLGLVFAVPLPWPPMRARTLAAGAVVGLLVAAPGARAAEIVAGGTIADALAGAHDGDTVVVPSGVHRERVVVDRSVRLLGRAGAVIDGGGEGTVVRVVVPGVELRGLTIRGSGTSYTTEDAGVRIDHAAGVRVADVRIEDVLFGLFVAQGDRCCIEGSTIVGKDLPPVRRGDAIRLWYSSGCRLAGNRVERSRDVIIWYSAGTVVEGNVVRGSRYGLHYMYSNDNAFRGNRFEDDQVGAAIMYSRGIELTENAFSFSSGEAAYGLLLKDVDDVFIVGNRFVHNATGLFFDDAPESKDGRVDVRGNLIARNDVGVALQPLSRRIRFWENAFVGNRTQVTVLGAGSAEENVWAVDGRGNYWSDAVVYDADGDGVSELPYRAESTYEALADRYPVLAFFDGAPGAEAIDLAARLFPIFAPRPKLTDPHPLLRPTLSAWTESRDAGGGDRALAAAGAGLLALAAGAVAAARRTSS